MKKNTNVKFHDVFNKTIELQMFNTLKKKLLLEKGINNTEKRRNFTIFFFSGLIE